MSSPVTEKEESLMVDRRTTRRRKWELLGHAIISLAAVAIFVGDLSRSGLFYPDAPSHALNGIFYGDMIQEGGFMNPVSYAERYYVQYPSLTVGLYPPLFYVVEGIFFKTFGLSALAAKLAVLAFTLVGVNAFFSLSRVWFPLGLSLTGSVLLLVQPVTLFAEQNVMQEMPALAMSMLALYALYVGTATEDSRLLFWVPVFSALAFLTKQTTIFLLPVLFFWLMSGGRYKLVRSRSFILGVLVGFVMLLPWLFVNLSTGKFYTANAIFHQYDPVATYGYYFRRLPDIISYPVLLLSGISLIMFTQLWKRVEYRFAVLWAGSALGVLCFYKVNEPRYAIFAVPPLIFLSIQVISHFTESYSFFRNHKKVLVFSLLVLICIHLNPKAVWSGPDVKGFDNVANFIESDSDCVSVLYDGYFNSNFIFHMRAGDEDRRVFVFRASKVVFVTKGFVKLGYKELIVDIDEFYKLLDRYAIKYVVQEERDSIKTPANKRLRQWVKEGSFRLMDNYEIPCHGMKGFGHLLLYEYLGYKPKSITHVEIDVPFIERKISVKVRKQGD